jgi:hypothetical protein
MKVATVLTAFSKLTPQHQKIRGTDLWVRVLVSDIKRTKRHPSPLMRVMDLDWKHRLPGENLVNSIPATAKAMAESKRRGG